MAALREWLCSLVTLTLLLSALRSLTPEGALRRVGGFIGGLILLSALLRPLSMGSLPLPETDWAALREETAAFQTQWERELRGELADRVAAGTEAAIQDRAALSGCTLRAEAELRWEQEVPIPWAVTLYGVRDPALEQWISGNLGIPPERQIWREGGAAS